MSELIFLKRLFIGLLICLSFSITEAREYTTYVVRVVDGDTVEGIIFLGFDTYLKENIRIQGYDAPEIFRPKTPQEKALGLEAKDFLNNLLLNQEVILRTGAKERDKYGRPLGYIIYEGEDISNIMIQKGYVK